MVVATAIAREVEDGGSRCGATQDWISNDNLQSWPVDLAVGGSYITHLVGNQSATNHFLRKLLAVAPRSGKGKGGQRKGGKGGGKKCLGSSALKGEGQGFFRPNFVL